MKFSMASFLCCSESSASDKFELGLFSGFMHYFFLVFVVMLTSTFLKRLWYHNFAIFGKEIYLKWNYWGFTFNKKITC